MADRWPLVPERKKPRHRRRRPRARPHVPPRREELVPVCLAGPREELKSRDCGYDRSYLCGGPVVKGHGTYSILLGRSLVLDIDLPMFDEIPETHQFEMKGIEIKLDIPRKYREQHKDRFCEMLKSNPATKKYVDKAKAWVTRIVPCDEAVYGKYCKAVGRSSPRDVPPIPDTYEVPVGMIKGLGLPETRVGPGYGQFQTIGVYERWSYDWPTVEEYFGLTILYDSFVIGCGSMAHSHGN